MLILSDLPNDVAMQIYCIAESVLRMTTVSQKIRQQLYVAAYNELENVYKRCIPHTQISCPPAYIFMDITRLRNNKHKRVLILIVNNRILTTAFLRLYPCTYLRYIMYGDLRLVQHVLPQLFNNMSDGRFANALHTAIARNRTDVVKFIYDRFRNADAFSQYQLYAIESYLSSALHPQFAPRQ